MTSHPDPVAFHAGHRRRAPLVLAAAALASLTLLPAGSAAAGPGDAQPGAAGVGDAYFPEDGNGGYDALHYGISVTVGTKAAWIDGTAVIDARATEHLSRFDLDLNGLTVRTVTVDGRPATWRRTGHELVVTPPRDLARGKIFRTVVAYGGRPGTVTTPDGFDNGWFGTTDGATVVGEPPSASVWFPVDEHPSDKALYDISVTVPQGKSAISNGLLTERPRTRNGWTTWSWHNAHPMASYLVLLSVGDYDVRYSRTSSGIPIIDAVDPAIGSVADAALAREGEVIDVLEKAFGPYPFETAGGVVDQLDTGFALETQSRSFYSEGFFSGSPDDAWVVAHETAHQWFGDSVSLSRWQDVWLNEGFATYAEWIWAEHEGWYTPADVLANDLEYVPADDGLWALDISDPGAEHLFDGPVYERGGLTLQAVREQVGDRAFFRILKSWARDHRDGNGTTDQFIALAERTSGQDLTGLFDTWLFGAGKPDGAMPMTTTSMTTASTKGRVAPSPAGLLAHGHGGLAPR